MNVRTILGLRLTGHDGLVHRLRAFYGVRRLGHVWFRWLLLHAPAVATYLPS